MNTVYADYAATTQTDPRVVAAMQPFFAETFGNPSSIHSFGRASADALTAARATIARFLHALPDEIYFTSSGTESNNLAILGVARANKKAGRHIITSTIEHPSILNACQALERDGFEVTYITPDQEGQLVLESVVAAVRPDTILVSLHLANSEIGVVQDLPAISAAVREKNPATFLHTDACQATTFLELDVARLGVDLLSLNGSKVYGPKGVGCLFVRGSVAIFPILYGGGQEQSLRSGTENVPGIVGLACAVELVDRDRDSKTIGVLRDELQSNLQNIGCQINVGSKIRLPNHLSVTLSRSNETDLVRALDQRGVAVSSGSACSSRSQTDSHVLTAIGLSSEQINKTIRISLGRASTALECQKIVQAVQGLM